MNSVFTLLHVVQEAKHAGMVSLLVQHMNGVYHWIGCVMLNVTAPMVQMRPTVVRLFVIFFK